MKKTFFFVTLMLVLIIAGCNEKDLVKQIDGTWHIQNYSLNGKDLTHWYDSVYYGQKWTFSGNSNYFISWQTVRTNTIYNLDTIAHFDTTTQTFIIDSITSSKAIVPVLTYINVSGQWLLTNGNQFLQTEDTMFQSRQFQILSHTANNLHLLDGNKDYYLAK